MDKLKFNKEHAAEWAMFAMAGAVFGVPFGGGCYLGWAFVRGLLRLLS